MNTDFSRLTVDILINAIRSQEATGDHTIALARTLRRLGVNVRIFSEAVGTLPDDIQSMTHVMRAADYQPGADLCIVQYATWYGLAEIVREHTLPALFWYHGVTPPELFSNAAEQALLHNARQRTDLVWHTGLAVCTSAFTGAELGQLTGYPAERTLIVPLGINTATFAAPLAAQPLAALRNRWGLTDKRVLLYVGRIAEHKRIDLLLDALGQLITRFPTVHALIVGDTGASTATRELHKKLQQQAVHLGIERAVTFTGRVEAVTPYYQLAAGYVQPSQHEGFGVPLVEAMAAGVPVIASNSGAMPWVLNADDEQEVAGCLFAPGDSADLARQITHLLSEPNLRIDLIARGKKRAEAFTLQQFDHNVQHLINQALGWAQQPRPVAPHPSSALSLAADVAIRDYKVRSNIPGLGRLIEWVRTQSTSHLKEAYLDRIIEQQVNYNRQLAQELGALRATVEELQRQIEALQQRKERGREETRR